MTPREQAEAMVPNKCDCDPDLVDRIAAALADALARAEKAEAALAANNLWYARLTAVVEAAKAAQAKADRLSGWITNVVRSKANKIHPDWLAERAAALVAFDEAVSEYHAALAALEEA